MRTPIAVLSLLCALLAAPGRGQILSTPSLGIEGARLVAGAAETAARKLGASGAIAVVDSGGNLLYVVRLDGTFAAGARISIGKARTAALFKKPTKFFEDIVNNGRTTMVALEDFTPLQGGVPVVVDGNVVGAIGVSGAASAAQDEEIALEGAKAIGAGSKMTMNGAGEKDIFFLEGAKVKAAFEKGMPLVETSEYKVHASHRDHAGEAEVHDHETDIVYMLSGSVSFVTGGTVVDGRTTAPGETRGSRIDGGTTRMLSEGDVIIVPRGTPHWFAKIDGPVDYYVVKVLS